MRKESRAMDSEWALEVMHKAPYITVSVGTDTIPQVCTGDGAGAI